MKKILFSIAVIGMLASCSNNDAEKQVAEPTTKEVAKPTPPPAKNETDSVDFKKAKKYNYVNAPKAVAAKSVTVLYDAEKPYAKPVEVCFTYENGDTYKYVLKDFGLWTDKVAGKGKEKILKARLITDADNTVWIQGQTKKGKVCEFVFYGNPKHNGQKITPSTKNNEIKYREVAKK
jgi:hypothetical protein